MADKLSALAKLAKAAKDMFFEGGQGTFLEPLKGVKRLNPNTYYVNPYEAPTEVQRTLRGHSSGLQAIANQLEKQASKDEATRRKFAMTASALDDAVRAGGGKLGRFQENPDMRLLMQVDEGGRPVSAASFQAGDVYGMDPRAKHIPDDFDLDFTSSAPSEAGTLYSLGRIGGREIPNELSGGQMVRKVQDLLGDPRLVFETINKPDFSNLGFYRKLGGRPTGSKAPNSENPAYIIEDWIKSRERSPELPEAMQMELDFKRGGLVRMAGGGTVKKMLQGLYRGFAGENTPARTAFGTETYFVTPQRKAAEYYAARRAAETGDEPHVEMILADQLSKHRPYKLSIPIDQWNKDLLITNAKRVDPEEVVDRMSIYARGGLVRMKECSCGRS